MKKTFVASLVMISVALVPACKTRKTPPPVTTTTGSEMPAPNVDPPPVRDTATTVAPPADFVREEATPQEEVFPADIEELNRFAQQRGYVRDAFFNYGEAQLDDAAQQALTASATWLRGQQGAGYKLLIEGHCDERGTEQYNLALGDRRANIARDYLVTLGVDASRIRTVSYGEERPFEEGHDENAWAQNRRAHLVLVR
jgi:peptidoglycan-associated lipoprotein